MPSIRVGKASPKDIEITNDFLHACEQFWDNRRRYSLSDLESEWEDWDDEDEDKIALLKIRKELAQELGYSECDVDNRLIVYEFLKQKYKKADNRWGRVVMAADVLIDNCCDPTETHLAFYPGIELFHVAPEH